MTGSSEQVRTYPAGVTSWVDTEQPDVAAALTFYAGLFGWSFAEATPPDAPVRYLIAQLDGRDVAGIGRSDPRDESGPPAWNTYVATDDVDATVARLGELGGTVVGPPADAGPGGRTATFRDREGVELRLWQARRRLGAQLANAPGAWNFSDLHTLDPTGAADFYGRLFGWAFPDLGAGTAISVPGYGDHLEATVDHDIRARQAAAPAGFADVIGALVPAATSTPPHWHVTFTVADRDEAAGTAERLGADVLATSDTAWTRTATIRDPQGAVLTLSQFVPGRATG